MSRRITTDSKLRFGGQRKSTGGGRRRPPRRSRHRQPRFEQLENRELLATDLLVAWQFDRPGATTVPDQGRLAASLSLSDVTASDWLGPATPRSDDVAALRFGGARFGLAENLPRASAESISFWLRPDQAVTPSSAAQVVVELGAASPHELSGTLVALGSWTPSISGEAISLVNQVTKQITSIVNQSLPAERWSHVAFVWNAAASRYDGFLNGEPVPITTNTNGHVPVVELAGQTRVGQRSYSAQPLPLAGALDGFRLHAGSLSTDALHGLASLVDAVPLLDATTFSGQGEFSTALKNVTYLGDDFIPIDPERAYELRGWARSGDASGATYYPANVQYFGLASFDADYQMIQSYHVLAQPGASPARLTRPLNPGDLVVYLDNVTGWSNSGSGYSRVLAVYGYANQAGEIYPDYTYTRHVLQDGANGAWAAGAINTSTKSIQLRIPWNGPAVAAGTAVRNNIFGANHNFIANNQPVPAKWTRLQGSIQGIQRGTHSDQQFRPGTAFVKPIVLANWYSGSSNRISWRDVEFTYAREESFRAGDQVDLRVNIASQVPTPRSFRWQQSAGPVESLLFADQQTAKIILSDRLNQYESAFRVTVTAGAVNHRAISNFQVRPERDYAQLLDAPQVAYDFTTFGSPESSSFSTAAARVTRLGDEFIPADPYRVYRLSGWAKSGDDAGQSYQGGNAQYLGVASYDADYQLIQSYHVLAYPNAAPARLTQPLRPGDTVVHVDTLQGWNNGTWGHGRVLALYGYSNSSGGSYPDYTYTRWIAQDGESGAWAAGGLNPTARTITLRRPWDGPLIPTGTAARNNTFGATYQYIAANNVAVPSTWTLLQGTFGGSTARSPSDDSGLRPGTAFLKPVVLANWHGSGNRVTWRDVELGPGTASGFFSEDSLEWRVAPLPFLGPVAYTWTASALKEPRIASPYSPTTRVELPFSALDNQITLTLTAADGDTSVSRDFTFPVHCDEETSHAIQMLREYDPSQFSDEFLRDWLDTISSKADILRVAPRPANWLPHISGCGSFDWQTVLGGRTWWPVAPATRSATVSSTTSAPRSAGISSTATAPRAIAAGEPSGSSCGTSPEWTVTAVPAQIYESDISHVTVNLSNCVTDERWFILNLSGTAILNDDTVRSSQEDYEILHFNAVIPDGYRFQLSPGTGTTFELRSLVNPTGDQPSETVLVRVREASDSGSARETQIEILEPNTSSPTVLIEKRLDAAEPPLYLCGIETLGEFRIQMSPAGTPFPSPLVLMLDASSTATIGVDYTLSAGGSRTVQFDPNSGQVTITNPGTTAFSLYVHPLQDQDETELTETVVLRTLSGMSAALRITDERETIQLAASPALAREENEQKGVFVVTANGPLCTELQLLIDADVEHAAMPELDYRLLRTDVTPTVALTVGPGEIRPGVALVTPLLDAAGKSRLTIDVRPMNDELIEPTERVRARLAVRPRLGSVSLGAPTELGQPDLYADVTIEDNDRLEPARILQDGRPDTDNECDCACSVAVCNDQRVEMEPQDASATIRFASTSPFLPATQTSGTHGIQPIVRIGLTFPATKELPQELVARLVYVRSDGSTVAVSPNVHYRVNEPNQPPAFAPGDQFYLVLQADLTDLLREPDPSRPGVLREIELASVTLRAEIDPVYLAPKSTSTTNRIVGWRKMASLLVRNPHASPIAPGVWFPFQKQLLLNQTMLNDQEQPEPGIAVFRGDGSVSWYRGGQRPPESLSELEVGGDGYRLRHPYGDYDEFDARGRHTRSVDRHGNETLFHFVDNRLAAIREPSGRWTRLDWSGLADGQQLTMTDFAGRVTQLVYRRDLSLTTTSLTVTHPDPDGPGPNRVPRDLLRFDAYRRLIEFTQSEVGGTASRSYGFRYDEVDARLSEVLRPDGGLVRIAFHRQREGLAGTVAPATDRPMGNGTPIAPARLIKRVLVGNQDVSFANLAKIVDARGQVTTFRLDHRGRVRELSDALGFQYYFERNVVEDLNGVVTVDRGEVVRMVAPDPDNLPEGNGPLGIPVTINGQSVVGLVTTSVSRPATGIPDETSVTTPDGLTTVWKLDPARFYQPSYAIDELGNRTDYQLDARGNIIAMSTAAPTGSRGFASAGRPWQNALNPHDVNDDAVISAIDALAVINRLNSHGPGPFGARSADGAPALYYDTNGDDQLSAIDALWVVNHINGLGTSRTRGGNASLVRFTYSQRSAFSDQLGGLVLSQETNTGRGDGTELIGYDYYVGSPATNGLLRSITRPDAGSGPATTQFTYDSFGNLSSVTDALGRITYSTSDARNRLVRVEAPDPDSAGPARAAVTRYAYDRFDNRVGVEVENMTPGGQLVYKVTCYQFDALDRVVGILEPAPQAFDAPSSPTNWRLETCATLTHDVGPAGRAWAESVGAVYWEFHYDANGNLIREVNARGVETSHEYDPLNRRIATRLPRVAQVGDPDGSAGIYRYRYDNVGNLWAETDPLGRTRQYRYDSVGRLTSMLHPDATTIAITHVPAKIGWTVVTRDQLGRIEKQLFDFQDRLVAVVHPEPAAGAGHAITAYAYYPDGKLESLTDPRRSTTHLLYDQRGRLEQVQLPEVGGQTASVHYTYDQADQLTSIRDQLGGVTRWDYDLAGRRVRETQPDPDGPGPLTAPVTIHAYDQVGNITARVDPLGQATRYAYDSWFRRVAETDPLGGMTRYAYDATGNVVSVTDPTGQATFWEFDPLDRIVTERNSTDGVRRFAYDWVGNLRRTTDRRGWVIDYTYDSLDRVIQETWQTEPSRQVRYTYDAAGRLTQASNDNATLGLSYDALDRPTVVTQQLAGLPSTTSMLQTFDLVGNRTSLVGLVGTRPDLRNDYQYDERGRMTLVTQSSPSATAGQSVPSVVTPKRVRFDYDQADRLTHIDRFESLTAEPTRRIAQSTFAYDALHRLVGLRHQQDANRTFADYGWSYDVASRLTTFTDGVRPAEDVTYAYDARGQLTNVTHAATSGSIWNEAYSYDLDGNRANAGYTSSGDRTVADGAFTYGYDAEGNRTSKIQLVGGLPQGEVTEYVWNPRNELIRMVKRAQPGGAVIEWTEYKYDPFGRRVSTTTDPDGDGTQPATRQLYGYDPTPTLPTGISSSNLLWVFEDTDADGPAAPRLIQRFLFGPGPDSILAQEQVTSTQAAGNVLWPLTDHRQSVRDLLDGQPDGSVNVVNHFRYSAFGQRVGAENNNVHSRFGFTGREQDAESGLVYQRARYYDPKTGEFLSEDPLGFAGGRDNLFGFVTGRQPRIRRITRMVAGTDACHKCHSWLKSPAQPAQATANQDWCSRTNGSGTMKGRSTLHPSTRGVARSTPRC